MLRRLVASLVVAVFLSFRFAMSASAGDVTAVYNLSKMSSYIALGAITPDTYPELRDSMAALTHRYASVDFVLDFLHTRGDYGMAAVTLADSLLKQPVRLAILIGERTSGAAEQTAMFLRHAQRAVLVGSPTPGGLLPDLRLEVNNAYLTAYYDSLETHNIPHLAAQRFAATHALADEYADGEALLADSHHDGALIDMLNTVAAEHGIAENRAAFYVSGFTIVSQLKAELVREVFPADREAYFKALNRPIQQAVFDAMEVIQTAQYRAILGL